MRDSPAHLCWQCASAAFRQQAAAAVQEQRQLQRQSRSCARHLDGSIGRQVSLLSPCHHKPLPRAPDSPGSACCESWILKHLPSVLSLLLVSAHWQLQTRMLRCLLSLQLQLGKPCRRPAKAAPGQQGWQARTPKPARESLVDATPAATGCHAVAVACLLQSAVGCLAGTAHMPHPEPSRQSSRSHLAPPVHSKHGCGPLTSDV